MSEVSIGAVPGGSADLRGYLARPSGAGPFPAVIAIHELFGVDDQFRRHCDRLAAAGYLTLGLNLFSDGGPRRCIVTTMRALFRGKGKPIADIDAGAPLPGRLRRLDRQDRDHRLLHGRRIRAAHRAARVRRRRGQLRTGAGAREEVFRDACPIVASYGGRDLLMAGQAEARREGADLAGATHDFKVYPGVGPLVPQRRDGRAAGVATDRAGAQRRARSRGREGCLGPHRGVLREHVPALVRAVVRLDSAGRDASLVADVEAVLARPVADRGGLLAVGPRATTRPTVAACRPAARRWRCRRSTCRAASRRCRR